MYLENAVDEQMITLQLLLLKCQFSTGLW